MNRILDDTIFWPLTSRGFFSEYNVMLWVLLYSRLSRRPFCVEVGESSLVSTQFAKELFKIPVQECGHSLAIPSDRLTYVGVIKQKLLYLRNHSSSLNPSSLFRKLWRPRFERVIGRGTDLLQVLHALHNEVWNYEFVRSIETSWPEPGLPLEYVAMHIRRGDKIESEASYVHAAEYLARIPPKLQDLPVVVCTDDYAAFEETKALLAGVGKTNRVLTTAGKHDSGFREDHFRSSGVHERELVVRRTLVDFQVLCRAAHFVGSFSSNLSRAVHVARAGRASCSVDTEFAIVQ